MSPQKHGILTRASKGNGKRKKPSNQQSAIAALAGKQRLVFSPNGELYNMALEYPPFEDVSPAKNWMIFHGHVSFQEVHDYLKSSPSCG